MNEFLNDISAGDPIDLKMDQLQQTLDGQRDKLTNQNEADEERKARRAAIEPKLAQIKQQAEDLRKSLKHVVNEGEFFKDVGVDNFYKKELWRAKTEAMDKRVALAKQIDEMMAMLKQEGVDSDHPTMKALHEVRAEATPNFAAKAGLSTIDFTVHHPWKAGLLAVGLFLANNAIKPKNPADDHWWKKLLRWTGLGLAAAFAVNHFSRKDRAEREADKIPAATDAEMEYGPLPTSPESEALAINTELPYPGIAWSKRTPNGGFDFTYPAPPMIETEEIVYGPVEPRQAYGPYLRPDTGPTIVPDFMRPRPAPYPYGRNRTAS